MVHLCRCETRVSTQTVLDGVSGQWKVLLGAIAITEVWFQIAFLWVSWKEDFKENFKIKISEFKQVGSKGPALGP